MIDPVQRSYEVFVEADGSTKCKVHLKNNSGELVHEYELQTSAELAKAPMPGQYADRYAISPAVGCYQLAHDILVDFMACGIAFGGAVLAEFIRDFLKDPELVPMPGDAHATHGFSISGVAVNDWLVFRGLLGPEKSPEPAKTDLENAGLTGDAPNPSPEA